MNESDTGIIKTKLMNKIAYNERIKMKKKNKLNFNLNFMLAMLSFVEHTHAHTHTRERTPKIFGGEKQPTTILSRDNEALLDVVKISLNFAH